MKSGTGYRGAVGFLIGVDSGKEAILYASGLTEPGPRYMHFPIDYQRGYDLDYFRGLIRWKSCCAGRARKQPRRAGKRQSAKRAAWFQKGFSYKE